MGSGYLYQLDTELLHRIEEISSLCERIEHAAELPGQGCGAQHETAASAKALRASVKALKRELLQQYLEFRIADAAREPAVLNQ